MLMQDLSPATCRAARGLLDWTQRHLAEAAGLGLSTVKGFEAATTTPMRANLDAMQRALEAGGVIFIAEDSEGPGVRLRRSPSTPQG